MSLSKDDELWTSLSARVLRDDEYYNPKTHRIIVVSQHDGFTDHIVIDVSKAEAILAAKLVEARAQALTALLEARPEKPTVAHFIPYGKGKITMFDITKDEALTETHKQMLFQIQGYGQAITDFTAIIEGQLKGGKK